MADAWNARRAGLNAATYTPLCRIGVLSVFAEVFVAVDGVVDEKRDDDETEDLRTEADGV